MATAVAQRLAARIASGAFSETVTLISQSPGYRDNKGYFREGAMTTNSVGAVTHPVEGEERDTVPEGLRTEELRAFYLAVPVIPVVEGKTGQNGDIIVWGGKNWRVVVVEDWGGFWKAIGSKLRND